MTTAVVILNWNGEAFLKKYLPSVVDSVSDLPDVRVVVADNASTDGSVALLKKEFPTVELIRLKTNYGFAKGYDMALKRLDDDLFVLLNSDVEVESGWIEALVEWMELHPDCGVCGPKLHRIDERDSFEYAGAAGGFIDKYGYPFCRGRVMDMIEKDEGQYDTPGEVFWISGAAMMVRAETFFALGGLRPEFFMHMEEIDFCWRARLNGWKVHIVPRSTVYHLGGGTLTQNSPTKAYYNHRNNLLMLHYNAPMTYAVFMGMETLADVADMDAGPDFFGNCYDVFCDDDTDMNRKIVRIASGFGMKAMKLLIFERYLMDTLTAFAYLCQFKPKCFAAVVRAHRDFRRMRKKHDVRKMDKLLTAVFSGRRNDIVNAVLMPEPDEDSVNVAGENVLVKGMYGHWMVWRRYFGKRCLADDVRRLI